MMEYTKFSCLLLATNARIIKIPILKFQIPTSILVPPKTTLTIGFGRRASKR